MGSASTVQSFQTPKPYRVTHREKLPGGGTLSHSRRLTENQARKLRGEVGAGWYEFPMAVLIAIGIVDNGGTEAGKIIISVVLAIIFIGWCYLVHVVHKRMH